ncbi:MAG: GPR endopeptidase [Firmicutes bacterium]|nr:GPR endopeptidase [Bacillota bacterium]
MPYSIRTDLALEAREALLESTPGEMDGVLFENRRQGSFDTLISTVQILNETGAQIVGKPIGTYITLENPYLRQNILTAHEEIMDILTSILQQMLPLKDSDTILVVGLGNREVSADALGPLAVSGLLVSRHMRDAVPLELQQQLRSVCAFAPGVM